MKIKDLKDKEKVKEIDVKIIYDQTDLLFNGTIHPVCVADADSDKKGPTAWLDLPKEYIKKFKQFDKIKILDAYSKRIQGKDQYRIVCPKQIEVIK